jgi:uncharacterized protein (TIGR02600 family)
VISCLALMSMLVLAFLASVRTEQTASKNYSSGSQVRMQADSAVNLAIGQIQQATQREGEAWTSQAGLIRTWGSGGRPVKAFKLYSDDEMVVDGAFDPAAGDDIPPADWVSREDEFVDLNSPVQRNGVDHYPILNPAAATAGSQVEGFDILDPSRGVTMPVKWVYVLEDGTMVTATSTGPDQVTIPGASEANPPVARLAFWADDESCKANINTASEGTFADVPVCSSYPSYPAGNAAWSKQAPAGYIPNPEGDVYEFDLSYYQPAQFEYQRYSGHPATTCLSPIFGDYFRQALMEQGVAPTRVNILEQIYRISPKYTGGVGSSYSGTVRPATGASYRAGNRRLYASLDELLYSDVFDASANGREENWIHQSANRRELLEWVRFFATAHSKAPEQTLFNTPRIAAWPIHREPSKRTAYDQLIAFCSTVRGGAEKPFYFTRANPLSPTADFSGRNTEIYRYLQDLTSKPFPGFGPGTFSSKLGADRDQVLTEIFDYIRITNLVDNSEGNTLKAYTQPTPDLIGHVVPIRIGDTQGFGRFPTVTEVVVAVIATVSDEEFAVAQAEPDPAKRGYDLNNTQLQVAIFPEMYSPTPGYVGQALNFTLRIEGLSSIQLNGQSPFLDASKSCGDSHEIVLNKVPNLDNQTSRLGGYMGVQYPLANIDVGAEASFPIPLDSPGSWPIGEVKVSGTAEKKSKVTMSSAQLRFKLISGGEEVQSGVIQVPQVSFEVPRRGGANLRVLQDGSAWRHDYRHKTKGHGYIDSKGKPQNTNVGRAWPNLGINENDDFVMSLAPVRAKGDYRLVAATHDDFGKWFERYVDPVNSAKPVVHSIRRIRESLSNEPGGQLFGKISNFDSAKLVKEIDEIPDVLKLGAVDKGVLNNAGQPGDWDNVPGLMGDGAFINRPDEGQDPSFQSNTIPYIGGNFEWKANDGGNLQLSTYFSPNRLMPSPVMLGSLPTGVKREQPWQTLLFRPALDYLPGGTTHAGAQDPPDHLLLDLFWNPVVEPYAISEPFATSGKVNLNYQIVPFTYIRRATGLHSILKPVMMTALDPYEKVTANPNAADQPFAVHYKKGLFGGTPPYGGTDVSVRHAIDIDRTLAFFEERFSRNDPFISASEICEIPLVPVHASMSGGKSISAIESDLKNFWKDRVLLTGDNSLERPYAFIYPRVTTRSNTYQVHVRAQVLAKVRTEGGSYSFPASAVQGEFRGSFVIERYLDPNLQDFDESQIDRPLGPYKCRVILSKQWSL